VPASILLISSDPALHTAVSEVLRSPSYTVSMALTPDESLARASQSDILVLDTTGDGSATLDLCRRLRSDPAMSAVPLLVVAQSDDVEERIRFLEVGADDVIGRPFDGRELEARVEALVARFGRSQSLAPIQSIPRVAPRQERRSVAVFSPKGGVGTTTVAANVAIVAGSRQPHGVVLIDLDLQFGGIAVHLDLAPQQTIVDLVRDEQGLLDPELLRGYTARHDSGLHVLAGTARPEQTELLGGHHLEQLLNTASRAYGTVIVDAGSNLDERTLQILDWADTVVLPFHPEIPALKSVHSLLDYLNATGDVVGKCIFVLNNAFARQALRMRDIEAALGTRVAIELPYDPLAYLNAANEGIPVVIGAPRSAAAVHLTKLADMVLGDGTEPAAPEAPQPKPRFGGLFGRS
jgi:pilus assembly protein CpaE